MNNNYPKTSSEANFPQMEEKILKYWQENNVFEKSVKQNEGKKEWIFYDGPPFANGLPHYGHLLTSCIKDLYARFHTQLGKKVERRFGWDCHGLPAEMEAEKELGIQGQIAIKEYGIEKFNQACRTSVLKYTSEWQNYINRIARWVDFDNDYKTMDTSYMESVMWAFKTLYDKGLIYKGYKVMPYSWACETPLSNFETRLDNAYREREDKAISVGFLLNKKFNSYPTQIIAWTTTPWTLPSNLALAVSPKLTYSLLVNKEKNQARIVAKFSIGSYLEDGFEEAKEIAGKDLIGLEYTPLLPYFANIKNAFKVLSGDFIEEGSGTGIVHLASGFGEDDQRVCVENNIPVICPVDERGRFTDEIFDVDGLSLKHLNVIQEVNEPDSFFKPEQIKKFGLVNLRIIYFLKQRGQLIREEIYKHSYPHCWRTDTPLIYRAVDSWYLKVVDIKNEMVRLNQNINWIPENVKDGIFGKWLENAHDWSISRNRFWGSPIPVWQSNNPKNKKLYVFGSIQELEHFFGVKVKDLHRPYIDNLELPDPLDSKYTIKRVSEVLDCWFESGSMPFAQVHYPFENKQWFEKHFPADFIVEYVAQTRGWFYTMMVIGVGLFGKEPFKNSICHGVLLGESIKDPNTGILRKQKLSKRLKNYPEPKEIFDTIGADAMRWFLLSSPVVKGGEMEISKDGKEIREVVRLIIKPIWNAYHFFCTYANIDGVKAVDLAENSNENLELIDIYILSKLKQLITETNSALIAFDSNLACKKIEDFMEVLNNWYIRRNRERFWSDGLSQNKISAYNTLYTCLLNIAKISAPIIPYLAEEIYLGLA